MTTKQLNAIIIASIQYAKEIADNDSYNEDEPQAFEVLQNILKEKENKGGVPYPHEQHALEALKELKPEKDEVDDNKNLTFKQFIGHLQTFIAQHPYTKKVNIEPHIPFTHEESRPDTHTMILHTPDGEYEEIRIEVKGQP